MSEILHNKCKQFGSHAISTKHVVSMYWNVCLMMVTCNRKMEQLCINEYIVVFWLNDFLVCRGWELVPSRPYRTHIHTHTHTHTYRRFKTYTAKYRPSTRQNICEPLRVISVKHSSVLPMMDHIRPETCRSDF